MEEEKDINQNSITDTPKELVFPISHQAFLKTILRAEKLVTALYMVTDCIDGDDPMKMKLRDRGVHLLSHLHAILVASASNLHSGCATCISVIREIKSFLSIASSLGFISAMNHDILNQEFEILNKKLSEEKDRTHNGISPNIEIRDRHHSSSFVIPQTLLSDLENIDNDLVNIEREIKDNHSHKGHIKDIQKDKKISHALKVGLRVTRSDAILRAIKDKGQAGIKDITDIVTGCSEKTIQRELNMLIKNNKVKKVGKKRWAKYELI